MNKYKLDVSIIIVNYKVRDKVLNCIKSIYSSNTKYNYEIIVVDNERDRLLSASLEGMRKVKYVQSKSNLGYGGGCNLGSQSASGEFLFILNPDTLVKQNTLDNIV